MQGRTSSKPGILRGAANLIGRTAGLARRAAKRTADAIVTVDRPRRGVPAHPNRPWKRTGYGEVGRHLEALREWVLSLGQRLGLPGASHSGSRKMSESPDTSLGKPPKNLPE
ncbi:MAG: hypothetical protein ACYTHM_00710 [Planctomycetota bacterium]|jgi:hypothetical protein